MKHLFFIILFFTSTIARSQNDEFIYEKAQKMVKAFNSDDANAYVDYLLPLYYGNKIEGKMRLQESFAKMLPNIVDTLEVSRTGLIKEVEYGKQFVFSATFRSDTCFVLGYWKQKEDKLYFSQPITRLASVENLEMEIPEIQAEILNYVLPGYSDKSRFIVGETLPSLDLVDLERKPYKMKEKESGLYIINMWGLSCKPCIQEIPNLNEFRDRYKNLDVEFIAIAWNSDLDKIKDIFLPKHPFHYIQYVIENAEDIELGAFPTHLVVNAQLTIIDKLTGATKENISTMERYVRDHISK